MQNLEAAALAVALRHPHRPAAGLLAGTARARAVTRLVALARPVHQLPLRVLVVDLSEGGGGGLGS